MIEQVANVCQTTIVRDAWDRGQELTVHGWVYGLKDGLVRDLSSSVMKTADAINRLPGGTRRALSTRTSCAMSDARWLVVLCLSRVGFSLIFTVYSALLPVLMGAWQMSAADAGLVQSGWHVGYLISLFAAGLLTDRIGARRTFLLMSVGACVSAVLFAIFSNGFLSALALYLCRRRSFGRLLHARCSR